MRRGSVSGVVVRLAGALVLFALLAPVVHAHGGGAALSGDSLAEATLVGLPSRIFEPESDGLTVHYLRLSLDRAREVRFVVAAPPDDVISGVPTLSLFGPGLPAEGATPSGVERPPRGGALTFPATARDPFTLPALGARWTGLLDRSISLEAGEFYIVLRTEGGSPMAVLLTAPGSGWLDLFLVPGQRDDARVWSGAPAWPALLAGGAGGGAVVALAWRRRDRAWSLHALAAYTTAALVGASTFSFATDVARSGAGWLVVAAGVLAAALALWSARLPRARPTRWERTALAIAGVLALVGYAGFLWGPVAAIAGALMPEPAAP